MISALHDRMLSKYVTGNPGFVRCVDELCEYQNPPLELVFLSIKGMGEDVDTVLKVCELVVKASKYWCPEQKDYVFEKMKVVEPLFLKYWRDASVFERSCALWVAVGKSNAYEILKMLPEVIQGMQMHDSACATYAACLLAQMVYEIPEINVKCLTPILSLWNTNDTLCDYQCLRYLMHATAVSEDARCCIAAAVHDKLHDKIFLSKNKVQACALGLLQNLLMNSPKRVALFKGFTPMLKSLDLQEPRAMKRRNACVSLLRGSRIPYVTLFVALMISIALWLRSEQALRKTISGTTPLR